MSEETAIEQIRAAREITVALLDKALISFTQEELAEPKRLAVKIGSIYAILYDAVRNPGVYVKK